jgi:hypothetical protein
MRPTLSPVTAFAMSSSIDRSLQNFANPATPPNDVIASSTATSRIRGTARVCRPSRWASRPRARPRLVVRRLTLWMIGATVVCAWVMPRRTRVLPEKFQGATILCSRGSRVAVVPTSETQVDEILREHAQFTAMLANI